MYITGAFRKCCEKLTLTNFTFQFVESTSIPYSAIIDAFDSLGVQLQQHQYQEEMKECLKYEGNILTKLIPSFSAFDAESLEQSNSINLIPDQENKDSFTYASERLAIAFRSFLRNFTVKVRPLLTFLDDLQWADSYSKELSMSVAKQRANILSFCSCSLSLSLKNAHTSSSHVQLALSCTMKN